MARQRIPAYKVTSSARACLPGMEKAYLKLSKVRAQPKSKWDVSSTVLASHAVRRSFFNFIAEHVGQKCIDTFCSLVCCSVPL
jgi:hypothetical protein